MSTPSDQDEQTLDYYRKLLDYQNEAYQAAEAGNYAVAIEVWTKILSEEAYRDFFSRDEEAIKDIAWNLAATHWANGDQETAVKIFEEWGFQPEEYRKAVEFPA